MERCYKLFLAGDGLLTLSETAQPSSNDYRPLMTFKHRVNLPGDVIRALEIASYGQRGETIEIIIPLLHYGGQEQLVCVSVPRTSSQVGDLLIEWLTFGSESPACVTTLVLSRLRSSGINPPASSSRASDFLIGVHLEVPVAGSNGKAWLFADHDRSQPTAVVENWQTPVLAIS